MVRSLLSERMSKEIIWLESPESKRENSREKENINIIGSKTHIKSKPLIT